MGVKKKNENINRKTQSQKSKHRDYGHSWDNKNSKDNKDIMENCDSNVLSACRCMEISEHSIREAIRQGATTVDAVKRATMAGMGLCQSKTCFNIIARLISEETKIPLSQIRPMKIRIPVRPVKINSLDMEL